MSRTASPHSGAMPEVLYTQDFSESPYATVDMKKEAMPEAMSEKPLTKRQLELVLIKLGFGNMAWHWALRIYDPGRQAHRHCAQCKREQQSNKKEQQKSSKVIPGLAIVPNATKSSMVIPGLAIAARCEKCEECGGDVVDGYKQAVKVTGAGNIAFNGRYLPDGMNDDGSTRYRKEEGGWRCPQTVTKHSSEWFLCEDHHHTHSKYSSASKTKFPLGLGFPPESGWKQSENVGTSPEHGWVWLRPTDCPCVKMEADDFTYQVGSRGGFRQVMDFDNLCTEPDNLDGWYCRLSLDGVIHHDLQAMDGINFHAHVINFCRQWMEKHPTYNFVPIFGWGRNCQNFVCDLYEHLTGMPFRYRTDAAGLLGPLGGSKPPPWRKATGLKLQVGDLDPILRSAAADPAESREVVYMSENGSFIDMIPPAQVQISQQREGQCLLGHGLVKVQQDGQPFCYLVNMVREPNAPHPSDVAHNMFLSMAPDNRRQVRVVEKANHWEKFVVEEEDDGRCKIRSFAHNKYISASLKAVEKKDAQTWQVVDCRDTKMPHNSAAGPAASSTNGSLDMTEPHAAT